MIFLYIFPPICSVAVFFSMFMSHILYSFFLVSIIWYTFIYYSLSDRFIKFFSKSLNLLSLNFPSLVHHDLFLHKFLYFPVVSSSSTELYLLESVSWLRVGLLRVLYFFCQISQGHCKPETTFCVQFLPWGFLDHVVLQFRSQISLWKDLWLWTIKADGFFPSQFRGFLLSPCANRLIFS